MKRSIHIRILVISCLCLFGIIASDDFFFQRNIFCLQDTAQQCVSWNQTVVMLRSYSFGIQTYYHRTLVHTEENGPTEMQHLKIGDQILAYDYSTGRNHYMPLKGWFLRDKHAVVVLKRLRTHEGFEFLMNDHQNIAAQGHRGIEFPMVSQLYEGQVLHRLGVNHNQHLTFSHIVHQQSKKGLYAPYVEGMNFYIYPEQANQESHQVKKKSQLHRHKASQRENHQREPMILSHCLSNMQNPMKYEHLIQLGMNTVKHIWGYKEQSDHYYYESPMNYVIQMLAGDGVTKMGHQYYSSTYGYNGYGDDYNRRQQEINKKNNLVIGLLQMDAAFLITSDE